MLYISRYQNDLKFLHFKICVDSPSVILNVVSTHVLRKLL